MADRDDDDEDDHDHDEDGAEDSEDGSDDRAEDPIDDLTEDPAITTTSKLTTTAPVINLSTTVIRRSSSCVLRLSDCSSSSDTERNESPTAAAERKLQVHQQKVMGTLRTRWAEFARQRFTERRKLNGHLMDWLHNNALRHLPNNCHGPNDGDQVLPLRRTTKKQSIRAAGTAGVAVPPRHRTVATTTSSTSNSNANANANARTHSEKLPGPLTHTFFDGTFTPGISVTGQQARRHFFHQYAEDVRSGVGLFISELHSTPTFPMFADLDIKFPATQPVESMIDRLVSLAQRFQASVARFYPTLPEEKKRQLTIAQVIGVRKLPDGLQKSGMHLNMPDLRVSSQWAEDMANFFSAQLSSDERQYVSVDTGVYGPSGACRMPYSRRTYKCDECNHTGIFVHPERPRVQIDCETCHGKGSFDDHRRYEPFFVLTGLGTVAGDLDVTLQSNKSYLAELVAKCSVASDDPMEPASPGFVRPKSFARALQRIGLSADRTVLLPSVGNKNNACQMIELLPDDVRVRVATELVRRFDQSSQTYAKSTVGKVTVHPTGLYYHFYLMLCPEARYCPNKQGYHTTSFLYFQLSTSGLVLRCTCAKNRPGQHGKSCFEWRYPERPKQLAAAYLELFFMYASDANIRMTVAKRTQQQQLAGFAMLLPMSQSPDGLGKKKTKSRSSTSSTSSSSSSSSGSANDSSQSSSSDSLIDLYGSGEWKTNARFLTYRGTETETAPSGKKTGPTTASRQPFIHELIARVPQHLMIKYPRDFDFLLSAESNDRDFSLASFKRSRQRKATVAQ